MSDEFDEDGPEYDEDGSLHEDLSVLDVGNLLSDLEVFENDAALPPHQRCASHILNLVTAHDGSKMIGEKNSTISKMETNVEKKLKTWWRLQNKSSAVAEIIKSGFGVYLDTPCKTRWNSEHDARQQVISLN